MLFWILLSILVVLDIIFLLLYINDVRWCDFCLGLFSIFICLLCITLLNRIHYTDDALIMDYSRALAYKSYIENTELSVDNIEFYNEAIEGICRYNRLVDDGKAGRRNKMLYMWFDADVEKYDLVEIDIK